jgi:hypothetical protein
MKWLVAFACFLVCFTQAHGSTDILAMLERDVQDKMSPFLAGRHGSFYIGGQSLAQNSPLTSLWNIRENETLGFTHPYFRDARTRGLAIVCDEVTGCGHDLHGWDFYRVTRVLYGNVTVDNRTYVNPYPTTLLWRPDRLTARYELEPGVVIEEVKFFTNDDVMLNIITLLPSDGITSVDMTFGGHSFVDTDPIPPASRDPSSAGLPPDTQRSAKRNSTAKLDNLFSHAGCGRSRSSKSCSAVHLFEKGTAWAKPIDCKQAPFPKGVDCLLKEGPFMYDGMSTFLAASTDISTSATVGRNADLAATYSFTASLSADTPLVLGWVMGDDEDATRARITGYMTPAAAAAALTARSAAANTFLTTKVPQFNVTLQKPKREHASAVARSLESSATSSLDGTQYDVHLNATCGDNEHKFKFLHVDTLAACEAGCDAEATCTQVEFQHTAPEWCALYNTSTAPRNYPAGKYDCACKGPCPSSPSPSPGPGPKPPKPSPIPPMNRTIDFANGYYFGEWEVYIIDYYTSGTVSSESAKARSAVDTATIVIVDTATIVIIQAETIVVVQTATIVIVDTATILV